MIWTEEPNLPLGIAGHAAAQVAGDVIYAGGTYWRDGAMSFSRLCYRREGDGNWHPANSLPLPLAYCARFVADDALFMAGGVSNGEIQRDVYRYREKSSDWELLDPLPHGLSLAGAACAGSNAVIVGGTKKHGDLSATTSEVWTSDLQGSVLSWSKRSSLPGAPRAVAATVAVADRVYIFGGATLNHAGAVINHRDAWCYDIASDTWVRVRDLPVALRGMAAAVLENRYIVLVGGAEQLGDSFAFSSAVTIYDAHEDQYFAAAPLPMAAGVMDVVVANNRLLAFGGEDKARSRTARVFSIAVDALLAAPRVSVTVSPAIAEQAPAKEKLV